MSDADLYFLGFVSVWPAAPGCPRGRRRRRRLPVTVSHPVERDVTDYADFTGRTAAVDSVEVRAHVWGYLDKVNFKEGALVKKGDVLFEIDPRPYRADARTRPREPSRNMRPACVRLERDYQRDQEPDRAQGGRPGRI